MTTTVATKLILTLFGNALLSVRTMSKKAKFTRSTFIST